MSWHAWMSLHVKIFPLVLWAWLDAPSFPWLSLVCLSSADLASFKGTKKVLILLLLWSGPVGFKAYVKRHDEGRSLKAAISADRIREAPKTGFSLKTSRVHSNVEFDLEFLRWDTLVLFTLDSEHFNLSLFFFCQNIFHLFTYWSQSNEETL